jgi:hypothetical protein
VRAAPPLSSTMRAEDLHVRAALPLSPTMRSERLQVRHLLPMGSAKPRAARLCCPTNLQIKTAVATVSQQSVWAYTLENIPTHVLVSAQPRF